MQWGNQPPHGTYPSTGFKAHGENDPSAIDRRTAMCLPLSLCLLNLYDNPSMIASNCMNACRLRERATRITQEELLTGCRKCTTEVIQHTVLLQLIHDFIAPSAPCPAVLLRKWLLSRKVCDSTARQTCLQLYTQIAVDSDTCPVRVQFIAGPPRRTLWMESTREARWTSCASCLRLRIPDTHSRQHAQDAQAHFTDNNYQTHICNRQNSGQQLSFI